MRTDYTVSENKPFYLKNYVLLKLTVRPPGMEEKLTQLSACSRLESKIVIAANTNAIILPCKGNISEEAHTLFGCRRTGSTAHPGQLAYTEPKYK